MGGVSIRVRVRWVVNATERPSPLMTGRDAGAPVDSPAGRPISPRLATVTAPVCRSFTNTSGAPLSAASDARSGAVLVNATYRPSSLIEGSLLAPVAWLPPAPVLTRSVVPVTLSWTNTSPAPLVSPGTRCASAEAKATHRPERDNDGWPLATPASTDAGGLETLARRMNEQPVPTIRRTASTPGAIRRATAPTLGAERRRVYRWSIGT